MVKTLYSPTQVQEILQNPYVKSCYGKSITFTDKAKIQSIKLRDQGCTHIEVFEKLGFPQYVLESDVPMNSLCRWGRIVKKYGIEGLKNKKIREKKKKPRKIDVSNMSDEKRAEFYEARAAYFETRCYELEKIKKKTLLKGEKFSIIYHLSTKYSITYLCHIAQVSLSGYYAYVTRVKQSKTQEDREKNDVEIIKDLVIKGRRKRGYRMITMLLYNSGRRMNHKKVYRIMKKYELLAEIRQRKIYNGYFNVDKEHRVVKNILKRNFTSQKPFRKLGTDITYMKQSGRKIYFSVIRDMTSGEILSKHVSCNLSMDIITHTLRKLSEYKKAQNIDFKDSIIHSDQGIHYTHPKFYKGVQKLGLTQSMSRRGNCHDNAPTESFFGHMKDEIDISGCKTISDMNKYMDEYIDYYNNYRPQWSRKKMTPVQYRNYLLTK